MSKPVKNVKEVRTKRLEASMRLVEKYAKIMGLSEDVLRLSKKILRRYSNQDYIPYLGRTLAAGALYTATKLLGVRIKGKKISQEIIARKTKASPLSIRYAHHNILKTVDIKTILLQPFSKS